MVTDVQFGSRTSRQPTRRGRASGTAPLAALGTCLVALWAAGPECAAQSSSAGLTPDQRAKLVQAVSSLQSTDSIEVAGGRSSFEEVVTAAGITEASRLAMAKLVADDLERLVTNGTPVQSINAIGAAAALGGSDGADICAKALDPAREARVAVRIAAASALESRIGAMGLSQTKLEQLARSIARAAVGEHDSLVLADEFGTLTSLLDDNAKAAKQSSGALTALGEMISAAAVGLEAESPTVTAGALQGVRSLRAALARVDRDFQAKAGTQLKASLTQLEEAARAVAARGGISPAEREACLEIADKCAALRDKLLAPNAADPAK